MIHTPHPITALKIAHKALAGKQLSADDQQRLALAGQQLGVTEPREIVARLSDWGVR